MGATWSLNFQGDNTSYLSVPYDPLLDFGTDDFTIEWYQYETNSNSYPRPFSRGSFEDNTNIIAVSIEGSKFYYWRNNSQDNDISFNIPDIRNQWVHFAIARQSGITKIFMNGLEKISFTDTTDYTSTVNLIVGNQTNLLDVASFGGFMYYLAWNKGYARYTSNFAPVENTFPPVIDSTVLIVHVPVPNSDGSLGSTVNNLNVTYADEYYPPPPLPPPPPPVNQPFYRMVGAANSDNTVFYKSHSLAASIGSTVRNSRAVSRRT